MKGGLVVCGATSEAGKSWVVAGLCRLLARRGVRVAQDMVNAAVTADGAEIGRPDLVVLPGSKATRADLAWFYASARRRVSASGADICASLQMAGQRIDDPPGLQGPPGSIDGLGRLPVTTSLEATKVLDRPSGSAIVDPGEPVTGYRMHHGRVRPEDAAEPWLKTHDGAPMGWRSERTRLHGLFENSGLPASVLGWATEGAGLPAPVAPAMSFACARARRLDPMGDTLEAHLDIEQVFALFDRGAPLQASTGT